MNLLLHGIGSQEGEPIEVTDSLRADPGERFEVVLTNPPFGKKSSFEDLDEFIACYNPKNRHDRKPTWSEQTPDGSWRAYDYARLPGSTPHMPYGGITIIHKTRLLFSGFAVLCVLGGLAPSGAADQPDVTEAFRSAGEAAQPVALETGNQPAGFSAGSPGAPTPGILDRTPLTLHYPPTVQVSQAAGASGVAGTAPAAEGEAEGHSLAEVNRQLSNPISKYWALTMQFNNYQLANHQRNYNMQFQPILPVGLTKDWTLLTRPVLQLYNSVPVLVQTDPNQAYHQTTAFGDLIDVELLSPADSGPWRLGVGPSFIFPTATSKWTGQGKWQAGPAVVLGYLAKEFVVGVYPQQCWSIGGSTDRPFTSQMNLQPFAVWFFAPGWSLGYSGNILANWRAPAKDVWTVPLGLAIGKVVKLGPLPVKFALAGQYMVVRPSDTGQEWNIQFQITPVLPKLIQGTLFE